MHAVGGVAGLYIRVKDTKSRSWFYRYRIGGERKVMGLGGFPDLELGEARDKVRDLKKLIEKGIDPLQTKRDIRSKLIAEREARITFEEAAMKYIDAQKLQWKKDKQRKLWENTLKLYAYPAIGKMRVRDIEVTHIFDLLDKIWDTKTETASRLRMRIESVLDWATVRKYRTGDNPARWKGNLNKLLLSPGKVTKKGHFKALPYKEIGKFILALQKQDGIAARAFEFLILTATRSGEVRGAVWDEINLAEKVWIIPAERMKAGKAHRVPLSDRAIQILKALPRMAEVDYVFPSSRNKPLSDMALSMITRRMDVGAVPHGFRSTFRDWAAEETDYQNIVAEMALAHTIGNKVEEAYRRGDLFDKRKAMMEDWSQFCAKVLDQEAKT